MNSVSCVAGVKQMPANIVRSDPVSLEEREQITFNLIPIDVPVAYRRMCMYIILSSVQAYPNTGETILTHLMSTRYGYSTDFVRDCLRALCNTSGVDVVRPWSNGSLRKASERFYVAHRNVDLYRNYLESLHPEFCKLNVVWPQLEKGK